MVNTTTPEFSVVITCFNKLNTIERAISSALNQGAHIDVVVVDDFSTDGSRSLLVDFENKKIQVILSEENKGAMASYIAGFHAAKGRYIVMLDGDDILVPGFLSGLSKTGWLDAFTCIRPKMAKLNVGNSVSLEITDVTADKTIRPGSLFTATGSTGGAAFVFPKTLLESVTRSLPQGWPNISVQDHLAPCWATLPDKCDKMVNSPYQS